MTPLDYVWEASPSAPTSEIRGQLGRMLFSGDDVKKPVDALSGGEAARLVFARIIVERPNLLVLDEPTNHLDLESIASLLEGLAAFEGTILFVSHDRSFVSALATRILELTPEGPRDFAGTYAEYLQRCGDDHLDADAVVLKAKVARAEVSSGATETGASWEEQKRKRNQRRALPARRDAVLASIEATEAAVSAITARYTEPGFFEKTSREEIARLGREEASLKAKVDELMKEWESIEAELLALGTE
jgi:ABC-type multidrug transport system ATPase subunit